MLACNESSSQRVALCSSQRLFRDRQWKRDRSGLATNMRAQRPGNLMRTAPGRVNSCHNRAHGKDFTPFHGGRRWVSGQSDRESGVYIGRASASGATEQWKCSARKEILPACVETAFGVSRTVSQECLRQVLESSEFAVAFFETETRLTLWKTRPDL